MMTLGSAAEVSVAMRREARRAYVIHRAAVVFFALLACLSVLSGDVVWAVIAASVALFAAFRLVSMRKRGVWGRQMTAMRVRVGAGMSALVGLAFLALAVLNIVDGRIEAGIVAGMPGAFAGLFFAWILYANARFIDAAAAALDSEPVRAVCSEMRGLLRRDSDPPGALVLTDTRIAELRGSASDVSEAASIAIADIERMDANLSRGDLSIYGRDAELTVHRAPPVQIYAVLEALRRAGVPADG